MDSNTLRKTISTLLGLAFGFQALDEKKAWWARLAYAGVAVDLVRRGWATDEDITTGQPRLADAGGPRLSRSISTGAEAKNLTFESQRVNSLEERVQRIHEQMVSGTRDPKIYALARSVLSRKCGGSWCVPEKDSLAEIRAMFGEVRTRVRYTWDPTDYDAFQTPPKTLELATGDCFVKGTLVLTDTHKLVPIESLRIGDKIWGHTKWSTVTNTWEKGTLKTWKVKLNNGSEMRLTPNHKVWVWRCKNGHSNAQLKGNCSCRLDNRMLERIHVRELKKYDVLSQPERIPFGQGELDADRALVEGLFISDGFSSHLNDFAISGKDGHPKEEQKRLVERICTRLGIETKWHKRYITVKNKEWAQRMRTMGSHAPQKHALSIDLTEGPALALLRGIMADSGANTHGTGRTFTTTSRELFLQTRVLLKMAGLTASERYITEHGGLGENPIWRLGVRGKSDQKESKLLRVKEVVRDGIERPCFDIETDDHFVWLPEADWTTSQCDDFVSLLGALLRSIGYKVRSRVVWTKGFTTWNHIYLLVQLPAGEWMALDATVDKPAGWEVPKSLMLKDPRDFDVTE